MIEINLSVGKKTGEGAKIAGIDPSWINPKMMLIAFIAIFVPDFTFYPMLKAELEDLNKEQVVVNQQIKDYSKKLQEVQSLERKIADLNEREKRLARKLVIVKEIIKKKNNPFSILHYIAKNTPENVWIKELSLNGNSLVLTGLSGDWKSIGVFLENLKNSIFFDNKSIKYSKPLNMKLKPSELRFESFKIDINIVRFE
jgi:Tfp pilus assembly protein PilN